ncbi:MAG: N-formylglutamate amidohydrolase [Rhodobacteraceae bacterium]|nr:N-formylglutamate amidohydrolase [Paracoccaceae bacterium]
MNTSDFADSDRFRILRPAPGAGGNSVASVFSSPHSGRDYPEDLLRASRLNAHALRRSEDAFVERLFDAAPDLGAPLIHALAPRAYVDLNRGPEEMDPALIAGVRAAGLNPRLAAGLGVIPRVVAEGVTIYNGKLTQEVAQDRLRRCYRPYHAALQGLLDEARARTGRALLIDCHSMPSDALRAVPRIRGRRPEIILGDRFGVSCAPWIMAECERAFSDVGFAVARNSPFAGGYITQKYGRPARGVHAIQVEIDRALYLDEARVAPGPAFEAVRAALRPVIARLAALGPDATALAAE